MVFTVKDNELVELKIGVGSLLYNLILFVVQPYIVCCNDLYCLLYNLILFVVTTCIIVVTTCSCTTLFLVVRLLVQLYYYDYIYIIVVQLI